MARYAFATVAAQGHPAQYVDPFLPVAANVTSRRLPQQNVTFRDVEMTKGPIYALVALIFKEGHT